MASSDFRHGGGAAAVRLRPPGLHGGALLREQALPGVHTELPEAVGERRQPPLLHLLGARQLRGGAGQRQQRQRCLHRTSDPGAPVGGPHRGARKRGLDPQALLARMGRQHTDGQRGLQVRRFLGDRVKLPALFQIKSMDFVFF